VANIQETQLLATNPATTDKLAGRVAFVTGGTRGIGAAIAHSLAKQGATVAVGYNRDRDSAERFVAELLNKTRPHRASASAHQGNVGSCHDCRRTIAEVIDAHGRLDILVNNAGITMDKTVAAMTEEDWHSVLAVNLSGAFFLSQAALAHMLQRGTGRILNVSSVVGETGNIGQANYAASKSGLFGLTKTLAKEAAYQLARSGKNHDGGIGITVNTVTPGLITTEMTADIPEKVMAKLTGQIPVGRAGTPEEVARVVHFLAADASSYITGQVWSVNGGLDM
jgi:NAD(P)-dependent dehydrogenase (short-subunit alcohol dehydrogenase family)